MIYAFSTFDIILRAFTMESVPIGTNATELADRREFRFKEFCPNRLAADRRPKPSDPEMSLFDKVIYSRYIIEGVPRGSQQNAFAPAMSIICITQNTN
jgi:hypothetical protein